ncbi:unnamed protein product [Camellia sinensis]
MNHDKNSIVLNLYIGKNRKEKKLSFFFYSFYFLFFIPILLSPKKGDLKKVKDYFVPDSYLLNRWIGAYSESKSWGVLLDHFY